MPAPIEEPSWRKPVGMLAILALITIWSFIVIALAREVLTMHWTLQAIFFAIAGTVWILPLKPVLRWMETGQFR